MKTIKFMALCPISLMSFGGKSLEQKTETHKDIPFHIKKSIAIFMSLSRRIALDENFDYLKELNDPSSEQEVLDFGETTISKSEILRQFLIAALKTNTNTQFKDYLLSRHFPVMNHLDSKILRGVYKAIRKMV